MIYYGIFIKRLVSLMLLVLSIFLMVAIGIYFWPFLIAVIVSVTVGPIIDKVNKKTKINKKLLTLIMIVLVYGIIGLSFAMVVLKLIKESAVLINLIPDLYNKSVDIFKDAFSKYNEFFNSLPDVLSNRILEIGTDILKKISEFSLSLLNSVFNFILFLPNLMIHIVITVVSTYFITVDRINIVSLIKKTFPEKWSSNFFNILNVSIKSVFKYFKSQIILAAITFIEVVIALLLIGQKYPFTLGIILAILDFLPIVGAGSVMVPWAIYSAITGNISFAIMLIVILAIMMVIRQIIEPKIVSDSLGIKPLTTIIYMYIGYKVFGVLGMVFGPILGIILKDVLGTVLEAGFFKNIFVDKKTRMVRYFRKYE